jgi:hypothetical protein
MRRENKMSMLLGGPPPSRYITITKTEHARLREIEIAYNHLLERVKEGGYLYAVSNRPDPGRVYSDDNGRAMIYTSKEKAIDAARALGIFCEVYDIIGMECVKAWSVKED